MRTITRGPLALALLVVSASGLWAEAVTVFEDGSGDYETIQAAINAVSEGDTVLVGPGRYTGPGNRDLRFDGKNIILSGLGNPEDTTLDCESATQAIVLGAGIDSTTVIENFTFANGWAPGEGGGAIVCDSAGPVIRYCRFVGNWGRHHGGAIFALLEPLPKIRHCVFTANEASYGGAIYGCYVNSMVIDGCTFYSNTGHYGGAIHMWKALPTIRNCTFCANTGTGCASAIALDGAFATIERCIIAFNEETSPITGAHGSEISHCCVFGNAEGDSLQGDHHDNYFGNPLFCDASSHDYTLCADSYCLPPGNPWGVQIGAWPQGCGDCSTPVQGFSWGRVKSLYR